MLNRANSKVGMKKSEVEGALDVKIGFEVPSDRAVPLGVNRGAPPAIADAGCDFAQRDPSRSPRPCRVAGAAEEEAHSSPRWRGRSNGPSRRLSKQNENGAANAIAERPVALAGPVTTPADARRAGGRPGARATRTPS